MFPKSKLGFLCAFDLQFPKLCGYYHFDKEHVQMLKDAGVIVFRPSNVVDEGFPIDEEVDSVDCQIGSDEQRKALDDKQRKKALEEKMDNVIWKMNLIIVGVVCVVFGCLLGMLLQRSNSDVKSGAFV